MRPFIEQCAGGGESISKIPRSKAIIFSDSK